MKRSQEKLRNYDFSEICFTKTFVTCDICSKSFFVKLVLHSKKYSDKNPCNCAFCEKSFMLTHERVHTEKSRSCAIIEV